VGGVLAGGEGFELALDEGAPGEEGIQAGGRCG